MKYLIILIIGCLTTLLMVSMDNDQLISIIQDCFKQHFQAFKDLLHGTNGSHFKMLKLQEGSHHNQNTSSSSLSVIPSGPVEFIDSPRWHLCINEIVRTFSLLEGASCIAENRNIFFLETNVATRAFSGRKLCAFESAALANPNRPVVVLMSTRNKFNLESSQLLSELPNLSLASMDFDSLVNSSQFAKIWSNLNKTTDYYPVQFSDLVRLLVLHKFGGAYMDSDTFSISKFHEVPNFIIEDVPRKFRLNGGIMQFQKGNIFLEKLIDFSNIYQANLTEILTMGPDFLLSFTKKFCLKKNSTDPDKRVKFSCPGLDFKVLKKYVAHRWDTYPYINSKNRPIEKMLIHGINQSFAVHYFGHKIDDGKLHLTKKSPLYSLMRPYCPRAAEVLQNEVPEA